jgi:hypothetical protein
MTKRHKAKKAKATSTRRKTPNKPKHVLKSAVTLAAPSPIATIIAEEPKAKPLVFWPLEVMRWWMPKAARS